MWLRLHILTELTIDNLHLVFLHQSSWSPKTLNMFYNSGHLFLRCLLRVMERNLPLAVENQ